MKKLLIIFLSSCILKLSFAQSELKVFSNKTVAGKNYITNEDIPASEYVFSRRINNYHIDPKTKTLTVQLRPDSNKTSKKKSANTGYLLSYDLKTNRINWSKEADLGSSFYFHGNTIIETTSYSSNCLNMETGYTQWDGISTMYYVDESLPVGLGYKRRLYSSKKPDSTKLSGNLEGIYLKNGKPLWNREINREFGWNQILNLRDSVVLIAAAGLHSIDLRNGKGWDYNAITGKKDENPKFFKNMLAASLAALNGSSYYMTTEVNVIWDIASNIIFNGSDIYFASKEKISRLDINGKLIWSHPLPEISTSKSFIFLKGNVLYLINRGFAFMGSKPVEFGMPFIAAYNTNTGREIFLQNISEKKEEVRGYAIRDKELCILFKNRISKYSLINGTRQSEKTWNTTEFGEMMFFVNNQFHIKSDSAYLSVASIDSAGTSVYTQSDKVLIINKNLEITQQIEKENLYNYYFRTNGYKFLANKNRTIIVDTDNKPVSEVKASKNARLVDTKLYDIQGNSFLEIDLSSLIKN